MAYQLRASKRGSGGALDQSSTLPDTVAHLGEARVDLLDASRPLLRMCSHLAHQPSISGDPGPIRTGDLP
ncbi:hypothetical protein, partial [Xanthomonas axonopodis]